MNTIVSMEQKFNTTILMEPFLKTFRIKINKLLICYTIFSVCLLICVSPYYGRKLEISAIIMNVYKTVAVVHTCFYIEFISFFFTSIINILSDTVKDDYVLRLSVAHIHQMMKLLRYIKYFHYKIHGCCDVINKRFGWIIIIILMESIVSSIRAGIYIFDFRNSLAGEHFLLIRNYLIIIITKPIFLIQFHYCRGKSTQMKMK